MFLRSLLFADFFNLTELDCGRNPLTKANTVVFLQNHFTLLLYPRISFAQLILIQFKNDHRLMFQMKLLLEIFYGSILLPCLHLFLGPFKTSAKSYEAITICRTDSALHFVQGAW